VDERLQQMAAQQGAIDAMELLVGDEGAADGVSPDGQPHSRLLADSVQASSSNGDRR